MKDARIRRDLTTVGVILALLFAPDIRDLAAGTGCPIPGFGFPYGGAAMDNLLMVVVAVTGAWWLGRGRHGPVAGLGLSWPGAAGPLLVALATVPTWIVLGWQGGLSPDLAAMPLFWLALAFPFAEEVLFRGFGYAFLRRVAGWGMPAAVLVQALAFGFMHWWSMGFGTGEALAVFAWTAVGAVVFAILDELDGRTLWSGLVLHVSLNASWNVFSVSDDAVGGWLATGVRLFSALSAIALLWWLRARRSRRDTPEPATAARAAVTS